MGWLIVRVKGRKTSGRRGVGGPYRTRAAAVKAKGRLYLCTIYKCKIVKTPKRKR